MILKNERRKRKSFLRSFFFYAIKPTAEAYVCCKKENRPPIAAYTGQKGGLYLC